MLRIAVVGGGAAGAAVVGEFLRRGVSRGAALTWYVGRTAKAGRGVAYSTENDGHLLNVRAANMGLFADDVAAFARYAQAAVPTAKYSDFLPRALYGEYVETTLGQLRLLHIAGCSVQLVANEAIVLERNGASFRIRSDDRLERAFDGVVLALGAPPAIPLPYVGGSAFAAGRYVLDPWNLPRLDEAPARVVVVGAGLTGIDVMLTAARRWPNAQLVSISRHGQLPAMHPPLPVAPFAYQDDLDRSLRALPSVRSWVRAVREAAADSQDWRAVIDGLRSSTTQLWQLLGNEERARFMRHVRWAWELLRHRMAPAVWEEIQALLESGQLRLIAGRIDNIEGAAPVHVHYRDRSDGTRQVIQGDLVVQTTGFQPLTPATPHRLLRQMLATGFAQVDELGLGLAADNDGRLISASGDPHTGLRALGPLLRGTFWECTALPEIRAWAARIVRELPREISCGPSFDARKERAVTRPLRSP